MTPKPGPRPPFASRSQFADIMGAMVPAPASLRCQHKPRRRSRQSPTQKRQPLQPCPKKQTMQTINHRPAILLLTLLSVTLIPHPPPLPRSDSTTPPTNISDPASWAVDYEARLQAARSLGRAEPMPIYVRWLHSPKTGTSFANTLIRWGCRTARETFITPRKERPANLTHPLTSTHSWDWLFLNTSGRIWLRANCTPRLVRSHKGRIRYSLNMHKGLERWEVRHAVGLFRMPLQRVYSNYVHLSLHYNESMTPRESLSSFVKRTEFWGQQAKLLLGRHYRDTRVVTHDEAVQAAKMVQRMLFVGLTEEFQLSCRLFHALFGGVPHRAQFENVRPGIGRYREAAKRAAEFRYDEDVFEGWRDEADDAVYKAGRERFWADIWCYRLEIEKDGLGQVEMPREQPVGDMGADLSSCKSADFQQFSVLRLAR